MTAQTTPTDSQITIRRLDLNPTDRQALERLAALDSRPPIAGPVLGAEVDGELLAAISVDGAQLVANPFRRTSELSALLRARIGQLTDARPPRRRRLRRERPITSGTRPALGRSPPGEIVSLQRAR